MSLTQRRGLLLGKKTLGKVPTSLKSVISWLTAAAWDGAGLSGDVCYPAAPLASRYLCRRS